MSHKHIINRYTDSWIILALGVMILSIRLIFWVHNNAVNVLFSDQWQTFTPLFEGQSLWQIFDRQHGPHRLGISFVVTSFLMKVSHWNVNYESYFAVGVLAITSVLALILKYKLCSALVLADLSLVVLILSPLHYETILLVPSAYHSIVPLMLMFLIGLTFTAQNDLIRFGLGGILTALSIFTGFGIIVGVMVPFFYLGNFIIRMKEGKGSSSLAPAISVLFLIGAWALFFSGYVYNSGAGDVSPLSFPVLSYIKYIKI